MKHCFSSAAMRYITVVLIFLFSNIGLNLKHVCSAAEDPLMAAAYENSEGAAYGQRASAQELILAQLESEQEHFDSQQRMLDYHQDSHVLHREQGLMLTEDLRFGGAVTVVWQAAHNANGDMLSRVGENVDDSSYSIDLELENNFTEIDKLFVALEATGGEGVEDELKVYSNVNGDGDTNGKIRLAEAWYEHAFDDLGVVITIGKLCATNYIDTNAYANDETTQFLGRMFVNSPAIEFGDNAVGLHYDWTPNDSINIAAVFMDVNSDLKHLWSDRFYAVQFSVYPRFFDRDGAFRLIGWYNDTDHTQWANSTQDNEAGSGFGLSLDQELSDNLGVFFRYGWQDSDVYSNGNDFSLDYAVSAGVQVDGSLWGRENDVTGLAYGHIFPSDDYRSSQTVAAKSENHLELYYNFKVNDYLTITPDIQTVWRPFGRDATNGSEAIVTYGVRGQLSF